MKQYTRGLIINEWFLNRPEVMMLIDDEGAAGLGRLIELAILLLRCDDTIGTEHEIRMAAKMCKARVGTMKAMVQRTDLFDCKVRDGKMFFVLKPLRCTLNFVSEIVPEELDFVSANGNRTKNLGALNYGRKKKTSTKKASLDDKKAITKEQSNDSKSLVSVLPNSQVVDNKEVNPSPKSTLINQNQNVHFITESNDNENVHSISTKSIEQSSLDDGAVEKSFKFFEEKILDAKEWRMSTSKSLCINLEDDKCACLFAKWMYDYCIAKNKMCELQSTKQLLVYAANLLMQGLRTRHVFDKYLADALGIKPESKKKQTVAETPVCGPIHIRTRGTFEQLINGKRIGLEGQELPLDAPKLYNEDDRWSYKLHKYVKKWEWNKDEEMKLWREMKRQALIDRHNKAVENANRYTREHQKKDNITSIGDVIVNKILPNMNHVPSDDISSNVCNSL